MDRKAFLDALPFLIPLGESKWPPTNPLESDDRSSRSKAVLLDHFLSIEPLVELRADGDRESSGSVGPAFFPRSGSNDTSDQSMSKVDMVMYVSGDGGEEAKMISPPKITRLTDRKPERKPQDEDKVQEEKRNEMEDGISFAVGYVRIEGLVYQLDHRYCKRAFGVGDKARPSETATPTCLILQFSSCIFRIFSATSSSSESPDAIRALEKAQDVFERVLAESPSTTFPTIVIDHTQQEESDIKNSEGPRKVSFKNDPSEASKNADRHKRKFAGLCENVERLHRAFHDATPDDRCDALFSDLATNLASSYCTKADISASVRDGGQAAREQQGQIDKKYDAFFPTSRPAKRGRRGRRGLKSPPSQMTQQPEKFLGSDHVLENVGELLRKHKKLVQSSFSSFLLPSRG